jgi:hypothetical protein
LFDEKQGHTAHSKIPGAADLLIPYRYAFLDQVFLEPFWEEFDLDWGFWKDVLINIGGFIPFGFVFRAYLSSLVKTTASQFWLSALASSSVSQSKSSRGFFPPATPTPLM